MIRLGLTGNIGSGKTTVCKIFEVLEVPVFYSDTEAKKLYSRKDVKQKLKNEFGDLVFDDQLNIDFKKLAAVIFSDKIALDFINKLIHPLVFDEYNRWLKEHYTSPVTIHESAILFENHLQDHFDSTIVVSCPKEIRLERLLKRDKVPKQVIIQRMKNQHSDKEKEALADYLIINDGTRFLIPQVVELLSRLQKVKY
jgi:dephospho-CoA kinase